MATNKGRGRSRKASPIRRLTDGMKKAIVYLVCVSLIGTSMLSTNVFADEDDGTYDPGEVIVYLDNDGSVESGNNAVRSGGSGGGSGKVIANDSITVQEVAESASNAILSTKKASNTTYLGYDDGIFVTVEAPEGALPDGAELVVERYDEESEDYETAALAIRYEETVNEFSLLHAADTAEDFDEDAADEATKSEINMAALDIHFEIDGEEVEPDEPVKVSIDISDLIPEGVALDSLEVQHLVEGNDDTEAVIVADETMETDGMVNLEAGVAEFEVESFSTFTVAWTITTGPQAGASYTVNVTAYLDGTELDITNGLTFSSENDELDFETLLSDLGYGSGDYTFSYAIGSIGDVTYGSEQNPIAAVEIVTGTGTGAGAGQTTYFRIVYMDGTYVDVATSSDLSIDAYYTTPSLTVEIVAVDEDEAEDWELKAVVTHTEEGSSLSYEWWVTDTDGNETSLAHVANTDNTGEAFIVWDEGVEDNDEIVVHVKVTETKSNGTTETAEASYTLEYGDETVDFEMTYGPNRTSLPAGITVTVSNEYHTYTGTTDENGWVHDLGLYNEEKEVYEIEPGIYTITATYTDDYGNTYQCNESVSLHDAGNYSINLDYYDPDILTSVPDKDDWEHIDIKLSIGTSGSASSAGVTLGITKATIYTSTGEVRAETTEVTGNDYEFQLHWSSAENSHSTSFSSTDYIVIYYTLTENGETTEYSITIGPDTVYADGTTYPVDGAKAYKLYNYLYGTSYQSDSQLIAAGIGDIDISGMSLFLVGAILCDSSNVTGAGQLDVSSVQAGIDFALSINTINELATSWKFEVEKTYYNASMLAGNFEFVLYDATADGDTWTQGSAHSTLANSQAGIGQEGYSQNTIDSLAIAYSDEDIQNGATYYYILSETPNVTSKSGATITFDETVYGVKVQLGTEDEGDDADATVTATYYILTGSDGTYTATETDIETASDGDPVFKFENTYQEYVTISGTKVWVDNNDEAGKRPESITVNLMKNGIEALDDEGNPITATVTESDNWEWSFEDLPVWDGITENVYSISEEITISEYEVSITQDEETGTYTITNTYNPTEPETTEITVNKVWVDNDNANGTRPDSITVTITGSDGKTYTLTLSDENNWSATQSDLPEKTENDEEITYTVAEESVNGYTGTVVKNEDGTYTITNSLIKEEKDVDSDGNGEYGDDGKSVNVGDTLTYKIDYTNSNEEAVTVVITDVLDKGLDFVSAENGGTYDESTHTITWTLENVEANYSGSVTFTATVNEDALETNEVNNTARVTIGDNTADTNEVKNPVETPEEPPVPETVKDVDINPDDGLGYGDDGKGVKVGDTLTYKIDYTNPYDEAVTVVITDELDKGLDFVSADNGGIYDESTRTITWTIANVQANSSGNVTFTATVAEAALEKHEVENTAKVIVDNNPEVSTNTVTNTVREYFPIDEEIIPDFVETSKDSWEKNESVTEYGALEFEMSTHLPVITHEDMNSEGSIFTMYFHNKLDEGLRLDASEADDLHITIGGTKIDSDYYDVDISENAERWEEHVNIPTTLALVEDGKDDGCTFHVTVDLTALYKAGIITDKDLSNDSGETAEIIIFFYVDLEDVEEGSMDGSYKSVVYYQVKDHDEILYTSNDSIVYIYTYEIGINKVDSSNGNPLAGATFGVYYDERCTQPVMRYGEAYTVISDEEGKVQFHGLAAGTYYLKELVAPEGYVLTDEIFEITVGGEEVDISGAANLTEGQLDEAEFEVYYDEECTERVTFDDKPYTVISDSNGKIAFDLAAGTYYLKTPLLDEPIKVTLNYGAGYEFTAGNAPSSTGSDDGGTTSGGGGGSSYSGSGSGHSNSSTSGPGAENTAHESSGGGNSSGNSINTDNIGGLPQTGEGNTAAILMGLCAVFVVLLGGLFHMRRKTPREDK